RLRRGQRARSQTISWQLSLAGGQRRLLSGPTADVQHDGNALSCAVVDSANDLEVPKFRAVGGGERSATAAYALAAEASACRAAGCSAVSSSPAGKRLRARLSFRRPAQWHVGNRSGAAWRQQVWTRGRIRTR